MADRLVRRVCGVLRTPVLFLCAAAVALSFPSRQDVERECVTASVHVRPAICAVSDLDGDLQADYAFSPDLVGSSVRPASISIHLSSAADSYQLLLPDGVVASSFIIRDVDGDGQLDIALLGGSNETVGVFLNDGSGRFEFKREGRYLTAASRDVSELSPPPPHSTLYEFAEPGSGSYCTVCFCAGVSHKLPTSGVLRAASWSTLVRRPCGVARSRAP